MLHHKTGNMYSEVINSLPETPTNRNALGIITRKPQKKGSFVRKKNLQFFIGETLSSPASNRLSRQKIRSTANILQQQKSLDLIKTNLQEEIKFLSPKNCRSSKIISQVQAEHIEKSPKFARKGRKQCQDISTLSLLSQGQASGFGDQFTPIISKISLQSVINKNIRNQTRTNTNDDQMIFLVQNQQLRQQNQKLFAQLMKITNELQIANQNLLKAEMGISRHNFFTARCKNCQKIQDRQRKNKKQINALQIKINEKQKQLKNIRGRLFDTEVRLDKQREKIVAFNQNIQQLKQRLNESDQMQIELTNIITTLKARIGSDAQEMRYLGIQQSILLRKKQQCELSRAEVVKLNQQKQSLKKMVIDYKDKIETLRRVFSKRQPPPKQNKQRQICYDDLFQLSSELSTDGF